MTVLGDVFDSLRAMNQWQLLLAFTAGIGYTLAQGGLLAARTRTVAALVATVSALAFVLLGRDWAQSAMLVAFSVVGLGAFVAIAWICGRLLGLGATLPTAAADSRHDEPRVVAGPEAAGTVGPVLPTRAQRAPVAST